MKSTKVLLFSLPTILFLFSSHDLSGQPVAGDEQRGDLRIMFYNVENYFDTTDNSMTRDEEYTPRSEKKWNGYKYYHKTDQIFKTIAAIGGMEPPEIIGFAEIENDTVIRKLIYTTGLSKYPFGILHFDSPDQRGIDVGMIYRKDKITLLSCSRFSVSFPENPLKMTRDILYGKFLCENKDTLHVLVNHWPSRRGGKKRSDPDRMHVAGILRYKTDSILGRNECAKILIMGDFNDNPTDESIRKALGAKPPAGEAFCSDLVNMAIPDKKNNIGTYRYKAFWDTFDQIIVSGSLIHPTTHGLYCPEKMKIADLPFLLEQDTKYGGVKPKRTYLGPYYHGGFSDHLPVYVDIFFTEVRSQKSEVGRKIPEL